jgi:hypothetical protein
MIGSAQKCGVNIGRLVERINIAIIFIFILSLTIEIRRGGTGLRKKATRLFPFALIGLFGGIFRFYYFPLESILKILKALRINPVIIICVAKQQKNREPRGRS